MSREAPSQEEFNNYPSWVQMGYSARSVVEVPHDHEDTVTIAHTAQDLALIALGNLVCGYLFPELQPAVAAQSKKLREVAEAQDFFPDE